MPAQISQNRQRARRNHRAADRQPVEPVREVDGVAEPTSTSMIKTKNGRNASNHRCGNAAGAAITRSGRNCLKNGTFRCVEYGA